MRWSGNETELEVGMRLNTTNVVQEGEERRTGYKGVAENSNKQG